MNKIKCSPRKEFYAVTAASVVLQAMGSAMIVSRNPIAMTAGIICLGLGTIAMCKNVEQIGALMSDEVPA